MGEGDRDRETEREVQNEGSRSDLCHIIATVRTCMFISSNTTVLRQNMLLNVKYTMKFSVITKECKRYP